MYQVFLCQAKKPRAMQRASSWLQCSLGKSLLCYLNSPHSERPAVISIEVLLSSFFPLVLELQGDLFTTYSFTSVLCHCLSSALGIKSQILSKHSLVNVYCFILHQVNSYTIVKTVWGFWNKLSISLSVEYIPLHSHLGRPLSSLLQDLAPTALMQDFPMHPSCSWLDKASRFLCCADFSCTAFCSCLSLILLGIEALPLS